MMNETNRRGFLTTTAAVAAASAISTHVAVGAEESKEKPVPVRLAVIGVNGRGRHLCSRFCEFPEVEIAYICEPDAAVVPKAVKTVTDKDRPAPKVVNDFRTALDDPKVDAIVCAAPDHWHALATIWACQAGKDVYVEKPASHNLVEGRRMVEAARKYKRVVQVGTQRRSADSFQTAIEQIKAGRLGNVHFARTWSTGPRPNIGHLSVTDPPENLDYNLWAGPGPDDGYKKNLVHYHWHWRWNFGTGECGNNGIHGLDVARWGMGVESPEIITCGGGKYSFDDDQETPDTQLATFDFKEGTIQSEHRTWSRRGLEGKTFGNVFYGTDASLVAVDTGWTIYRGTKVIERYKGKSRSDGVHKHIRNFLDCLITRGLPNADIEIGHRSTSLCHLANIAWRTRSTIRFDGQTESILENAAASALLNRSYRNGFEVPRVV